MESSVNDVRDDSPSSALHGTVCSMQQAPKRIERREVEYVMSVKIAPVEPIASA